MDVKNTADNVCAGNMLFNCAAEGDIATLKTILSRGSPLGTDTVGTTALHSAVIGNQMESCEILLRAGISVDAKTKVDRTPLHLAAYNGHERIVKFLLDKNCGVDPEDMLLMTPLHWAVENGYPNVVRMLLSHGADPDRLSKFNKTPRSIAECGAMQEMLHIFDTFSNGQGQMEAEDATVSLVLEMRKEREQEQKKGNVKQEEMIDYDMELDEELELNVAELEEDDVVDVIPAADLDSIDMPLDEEEQQAEGASGQGVSRVVANDSDESLSNLHETINKLGNIRTLQTTDAPTLKMLQNIGIQMSIPNDHDPTIISNVLQSGRRIILSEAGKYILSKTQNEEMTRLPENQQQQQMSKPTIVPISQSRTREEDQRSVDRKVPPPNSPSLVKKSRLTDMERVLSMDEKPADNTGTMVLRRGSGARKVPGLKVTATAIFKFR